MSTAVTRATFPIEDNVTAMKLFGLRDENLKVIEDAFGVQVVPRGTELRVNGDKEAVAFAVRVLQDLKKVSRRQEAITPQEVQYAVELVSKQKSTSLSELGENVVVVTARGKKVTPKTVGQHRYVQAIRKNEMVFGIGPAGTGKTYLAMAAAVAALKSKQVSRIILTRPAVEAGERLGFLPGDLQDKVDPYLRPLYDALYDILGAEIFQRYQEKGIIEVAPLAYMRGRTLDDSFIILDEAQNTTPEQMKMFLTRMGFGSKVVVTGDVTQVDLPKGRYSGLRQVQEILKGINGISFVYLSKSDVVRHELVQQVIQAYEEYGKQKGDGDIDHDEGEGPSKEKEGEEPSK